MRNTTFQLNLKGEKPLEVMENHLKSLRSIKDRCVFGFSGGDDSTVLIDKAVDILGSDITVLFCNTHIQFKETYRFNEKMVDYWGLTDYNVTYPVDKFVKIVQRIGLHGIGHNKMICCSGLKNKPLSNWMHENNKKIAVSGLRMAESKRNCGYPILSYNQCYDIKYYNPMLYMSKSDVDRYIEETNCPKNPVYCMGTDRTGCAPCPNPLKLQKYSDEYPTYYDWLADKFPRWYKFAWHCQKMFYDRKCSNGDKRGYGAKIYRHEWKWPL